MEPNAAPTRPARGGGRQRELVLGAVAIALVATAAWRIASSASPATQRASTTTTSATTSAPPQKKNAGADVDLDSLKVDRPEPVDSVRDPFRFKPRSAPAPVSTPGMTRPEATPNPLPPGPPQPPPLPPIPMKFIGTIAAAGGQKFGRVAVLSDSRGVYHGREGDVIEGRYRIVRIGVESIELAYLDGRGRQTIAKTGQ